MSKLRVGVIGCGSISSNHIRGYLDSGRYEIVGLADLEEQAMAEKDAAFSITPRHYTDARAMLAQEQPDAVALRVAGEAGHGVQRGFWRSLRRADFRPLTSIKARARGAFLP